MEENAKMKKIVIVGTSCSGKTTLSKNISKILSIPHFELDVLHWGPNWTTREDFEQDVAQAVQNPKWVIDGNYRNVRDLIWEKVDTIIWLNYSFQLVFWRALNRTIPRVIMKKSIYAGNRETARTTFFSSDSILWWVIKTHKQRILEYSKLFTGKEYANIRIIQLNNQSEANNFLHDLKVNNNEI